ncbi:MAG: hypothetical protein LAQ30_28630, partial [Acidobacteriia bacterium]|nr:hypothetical protein [Terriglobia bacterium]
MAQSSTFRAGYVGEIPVRLAIARLDPRIIPDLTGSADVIIAAKDNAVVVPLAAVFNDGGDPFVFVKTAAGWDKSPGLKALCGGEVL